MDRFSENIINNSTPKYSASSGATRISMDRLSIPDTSFGKSNSDENSIDSCISLFDDDNETLRRICFDFDDSKMPQEHKGKSWCAFSSSSCCSLCRLSEDYGNESALGADGYHNSSASPPEDYRAAQELFTTNLSDRNITTSLLSGYCGNCNIPGTNDTTTRCRQCEINFNMPFKTISIPSAFADSKTSIKCLSIKGAGKTFLMNRNNLFTTGFIPDDLLEHILTFLDVKSLVDLRECNKKLLLAASNNSAGWAHHCKLIWSSKVIICSGARALLDTSNSNDSRMMKTQTNAMEAYKSSLVDAKARNEIKVDELCFDNSSDESGLVWSFRFKESAGLDWTSWDPWWNGKAARKVVFLRDGTMLQSHPEGRIVVKVHNRVPLYDVFSERVARRRGVEIEPPRIEMKWRFVSRPLDFPDRPQGAYIRVSVGGRDVPTYVIRRSPNGNWGFLMESCWGIYASFELAPHATATRSSRRRLRRTRNGSRWVNVGDSEGESGDEEIEQRERDRNVRQRINLFVEESAMSVTGYSQWREAFLYNVGAVDLPEGNDAMNAFNEAWHSLLQR
mmetsp:Transcript_8083/g.17089  ORF Transcript_8083/g.17089 Transcript_8083/m.17089 type:complete len:563 (+) Transcript_8083:156-1844(+)